MNVNMKYKLGFDSWDYKELDAINRVIESRNFTMDKEVYEFEQQAAKHFGSDYCVMVNSGSSANLIAIGALIYSNKIKKGDEIIVPAVSWSTTYHPLQQYGLKLRFVDIDLETLNYDLNQLEKSISAKTKLIFVVNLLGNNNNFKELESISKKYKINFIEDNCESMGSKYNNKFSGTFGLMGTFSTFYSHHLSTIEGGFVLTDDHEIYQILKSLRAHGWTRDVQEGYPFFTQRKDPFYDKFDFVLPGFNLRPIEFEAAIGKEQLLKLNKIVDLRQKNASYFLEKMAQFNDILTQKEIGNSSWFGFSIILKNGLTGKRGELVSYLEKNGIETRPIVAGNFTKNSCIQYFDYEIPYDLSNADYLHENGFFVGNSGINLKKEINYLVKIIKDFIENINE
jgi:CDP-6-deoxy-D-xylo-4-hexulose-3-dehydrase